MSDRILATTSYFTDVEEGRIMEPWYVAVAATEGKSHQVVITENTIRNLLGRIEMTYVVVKRGVYIQGIWGPYTKQEATAAAELRAAKEPDAHHTIEACPLNPEDGIGAAVTSFTGTHQEGRYWWEEE